MSRYHPVPLHTAENGHGLHSGNDASRLAKQRSGKPWRLCLVVVMIFQLVLGKFVCRLFTAGSIRTVHAEADSTRKEMPHSSTFENKMLRVATPGPSAGGGMPIIRNCSVHKKNPDAKRGMHLNQSVLQKIWQHDDRIYISTRTSACPRPHYMVRAVGDSLRLFNPSLNDPGSATIGYESDSPLFGRYIIDVTLITCHAFHLEKDAHVERKCMLRPPQLVYRKVHMFSSREMMASSLSGWRLCAPALIQTSLIDTRYQTAECAKRSRFDPRCAASVRDAYTYEASMPPIQPQHQYCFVGSSHARGMGKALARVIGTTAIKHSCFHCRNAKCDWQTDVLPDADLLPTKCTTERWGLKELCETDADECGAGIPLSRSVSVKSVLIFNSLFISDLRSVNVRYNLGACTHVFAEVGQWDLADRKKWKPSDAKFRDELSAGLSALQPTALLSINYNPLGGSKLQCASKDWRTPDVIDAYNSVAEDVAIAQNITFIDNNKNVIGPVWDSAKDWCHYFGAAFEGVAVNILWNLLQ